MTSHKKRTAVARQKMTGIRVAAIVSLLSVIFLMINKESVGVTVRRGLQISVNTLIPALFPPMVICLFLDYLGVPDMLAKTFGRPIAALYHIDAILIAPVLTGLLCGFPAGAVSLNTAVKRHPSAEEDAPFVLFISSFASPGFVIAGIGTMLHSIKLGIILWFGQLVSIMTVGLFLRPKKKKRVTPLSHTPLSHQQASLLITFSKAISEASRSMLTIVGTVTFFAIPAALTETMNFFPPRIALFLPSFFEMSSSIAGITSFFSQSTAFIGAAAGIGWSGLAVHAQIIAAIDHPVSLKPFFIGKIAASALMALLAFLTVQCI